MAGLKGFWPIPPKVILATPMDTSAPMNTTHHGVVLGKFIASKRPVTTADKSPMVLGALSIYLVMAHSSNTPEGTLTARINNSLQP